MDGVRGHGDCTEILLDTCHMQCHLNTKSITQIVITKIIFINIKSKRLN